MARRTRDADALRYSVLCRKTLQSKYSALLMLVSPRELSELASSDVWYRSVNLLLPAVNTNRRVVCFVRELPCSYSVAIRDYNEAVHEVRYQHM